MGRLGRYPRYIELRKLKTSAGGLDRDYVVSVRSQLRQQWAVQRDAIACALETSSMTEFHHWVRALLEVVHDLETGMSAVETSLPGLSMLLEQSEMQGRRRRDLYTALLVLSAWEQGYTGDASEVSLSTEARLVGLGTRALQELLRRAEPVRKRGTILSGPSWGTPNGRIVWPIYGTPSCTSARMRSRAPIHSDDGLPFPAGATAQGAGALASDAAHSAATPGHFTRAADQP